MSQAIRGAFDHGDTELRSPAECSPNDSARPIRHRLSKGRRLTPHEATDRLTKLCV